MSETTPTTNITDAADAADYANTLLDGASWLLRQWVSNSGQPIEWTVHNQLTPAERIALSQAMSALALAEIASAAEKRNRDA